ncbi:tyrosine-type recombinase/integrase [Achromobacter aloeverae]
MGRSTQTKGVFSCLNGTYEVDAWYQGERIRQRGFGRYADAKNYLIARKSEIGAATLTGVRPQITFDEAAAEHLNLKVGMPSWDTDKSLLAPLVEKYGSLTLDEISDEVLAPFVKERAALGRKSKTINEALDLVRSICRRAATEWKLENGLTWLASAPKISEYVPLQDDRRPPRPITWEEQRRLLPQTPPHLERMALFDLNTGLRESPLCNLRWAWEVKVPLEPGLEVSVFVVPPEYVKGTRKTKRPRIVVCNTVSQSIIESQRGLHPERVFTYARPTKPGKPVKHMPIGSMNNTAWQAARERAGLGDLHVHDLRHTVGMRLRDAGVLDRTQDDILWHSRGGMTAHYAVAQIREIYNALELIKQPGAAGESLNLLALVRNMQALQAGVPQKSPNNKKAA